LSGQAQAAGFQVEFFLISHFRVFIKLRRPEKKDESLIYIEKIFKEGNRLT